MVEKIIKQNYSKLSPMEKKVANKILDGQINVLHHSITQAANIAGVSVSLISKFCSKCGFSGWKTLSGIAFASLRTDSTSGEGNLFFSEQYMDLHNFLANKHKHLNLLLKKLNDDIDKSKKVIFFANSNTQKLVEVVAFKLNKLNLNAHVYSFTESSIIISAKNDCVIFVSVSGINSETKIRHYSELFSKCDKQHLITFGNRMNIKNVNQIAIGHYNQFPKYEKSFPIITDGFMLYILNKIVEHQIIKNPHIQDVVDKTKKINL